MKTDIIQAIMNGKAVQFRFYVNGVMGDWVDLERTTKHANLYLNLFDDATYPEWRIKPERRQIKAKLALMKQATFYIFAINTAEEAIELETNSTSFVEWLTDWITYNFEEQYEN